MYTKLYVVFVCVLVTVCCKPLEQENEFTQNNHRMTKRFISPPLGFGGFSNSVHEKMRAKRSTEEECEKLQLCKLHARSSRNFFAAFELYFVNKENARLWDHQAHSLADCERRYSCYR